MESGYTFWYYIIRFCVQLASAANMQLVTLVNSFLCWASVYL